MLPLHISIYAVTISIWGISLIASICYFLFFLWFFFRKIFSIEEIFDIGFVSILSCIILSRLAGIFFNFNYFLGDVSRILFSHDSYYSYMGIILGMSLSVLIIKRLILKEEDKHFKFLENLLITFIVTLIIFTIGATLSGRMLGVEVKSSIGLFYEDGTSRMPLGIFRVIYYICFLAAYYFYKKENKIQPNKLYIIFLLSFASLEFVLNFFVNGYSPNIISFINFEQLLCIIVFLFGIFLYLKWHLPLKSLNNEEEDVFERRPAYGNVSAGTTFQDYSYSFKNTEYSVNTKDFSFGERIQVFLKTLKRKFSK